MTRCSTRQSPPAAAIAGEIHTRLEHPCSSGGKPARTGIASPGLQARFQITASEAARFTQNLADVAHMVEPVIVRPLVLSDPADDPILYTAADGKADVLCTRNIRHFHVAEVQSFCAARGIRVMTDLDILRELLGNG